MQQHKKCQFSNITSLEVKLPYDRPVRLLVCQSVITTYQGGKFNCHAPIEAFVQFDFHKKKLGYMHGPVFIFPRRNRPEPSGSVADGLSNVTTTTWAEASS